MSESGSPAVPPASPEPSIAVGKLNDGTFIAHLHMADKLRTVFGRDIPEIGRRLVSTAISEFGLLQEHAHALVESQGLETLPTAAEHAAVKSDAEDLAGEVAELKRKLSDAAASVADLTAARDHAQAELDRSRTGSVNPAMQQRSAGVLDGPRGSSVTSADHTSPRDLSGSGAVLGSSTEAGATAGQISGTHTPPERHGGTSVASAGADVPAGGISGSQISGTNAPPATGAVWAGGAATPLPASTQTAQTGTLSATDSAGTGGDVGSKWTPPAGENEALTQENADRVRDNPVPLPPAREA